MSRRFPRTSGASTHQNLSKFKLFVYTISLVVSLMSAITVTATPANAVLANPTPTCSGATCVINFTSTNDYYAWNAPVGGTYTFEVWGGQGGTPSAASGKGGYAKGNKVMTAGTTLYVKESGTGNTGWTAK